MKATCAKGHEMRSLRDVLDRKGRQVIKANWHCRECGIIVSVTAQGIEVKPVRQPGLPTMEEAAE